MPLSSFFYMDIKRERLSKSILPRALWYAFRDRPWDI